MIFRCFPEINIDIDDVWIYGTNIYQLYEDIIAEYDMDWDEMDIDLPFVISKKKHFSPVRYKEDFVNIILVFDYEHHDPNFSEEKILRMQKYFSDAADSGRLYLNYPMIESYQHLKALPDGEYEERKIPVSLQPGSQYKELVRNETSIAKFIDFPRKTRELLSEHFHIREEYLNPCFEEILSISGMEKIENKLQKILQTSMDEKQLLTAKYQFKDLVSKSGYAQSGKTFWNYMKAVFQQIIIHNICKANKLQNGDFEIKPEDYKSCFEQLDFTEILKIQNCSSRDPEDGYIWILNTCVLFIAEYNFKLIMQ